MLIWLAKMLLFFSSFLFSFHFAHAAVQKADFLSAPQFYGTQARSEYEYKFAVDLEKHKGVNINELGKKVIKKLRKLTQSKELTFDSQVFNNYRISENFETFVFNDIYFDTDDKILLNKNAAYRLRYRWTRQEKYYRYRLFPYLSVFYPDRCEVQFKNGYKVNQKEGTVSVQETRFEFRNESDPFRKNKNAPPSPWLEADFIKVSTQGRYKEYPMLPMRQLLQTLPIKRGGVDLKPALRIVTERYRTHLDIKSPWGVGPNPDQAFILTFDLVSAYEWPEERNRSSKKRLLEFELEIDRNISSEVDRVSLLPTTNRLVEIASKEFSQKAKKNLIKDLMKIRLLVAEILTKEYGLRSLPVENKYSRLSKWLQVKKQ